MNKLTEREKELLGILKNNPMIAQEDLADLVGITRSAAAVHISNLIKKGYILGRGYVFNDKTGVLVAGSVYVEVEARESHTGQSRVEINTGGIGYRTAMNLADAGISTTIVTSVGRDDWGDSIAESLRRAGIDTRYLLVEKTHPTSRMVVLKDDSGELKTVSDRRALSQLGKENLQNMSVTVGGSQMVILESVLPHDTFRYLAGLAKKAGVPSCVVFTEDSSKILNDDISGLYMAVISKNTADSILNMQIRDFDDGIAAGNELRRRGFETAVVVIPDQGVCLTDGREEVSIPLLPAQSEKCDISIDKLAAGLVTNILRGYDLRQNLRLAMTASIK